MNSLSLRLGLALAFSLLFMACEDMQEIPMEAQPNPMDQGNNPNNNPNNQGNQGILPANLSALPLEVTDPIDNPSTQAKVSLGKLLFWDPILSGEKDVSCATCHHPARGFADGIDLSIGAGGSGFAENRVLARATEFVPRNSPTIINTAFNGIDENGQINPEASPMFWDNRDQSLESQATGPLHSLVEMRGNTYAEEDVADSLVNRLRSIAEYQQLFTGVFGANSISLDNLAKAISAYERSIVANNSAFDQYARGVLNAMNDQQIAGLEAFLDVGCDNCHSGPMFSDFDLHVLGVRENPKLDAPDRGDGNFAFRTPTLRNLGETGPYMHNGELNSLNQVLDFYDDNNNNSDNPNVPNNQLDQDLRNLGNINGQRRNAIVTFLGALNDNNIDRTVPARVPSGLPVGGNIGDL